MSKPAAKTRVHHLVLVLGDQLDAKSAAFDRYERKNDAVWMAEVDKEADYVWSTKPRIAVFLAAMRHFRDALRKKGRSVHYHELDRSRSRTSFGSVLKKSVRALRPQRLVVLEPGEWRVKESLKDAARDLGVPLDIRTDRHFFATRDDFDEHCEGRRELRNEYFYREMRRKLGILTEGDQPAGGQWNYDVDNRLSFGKAGPGEVPSPRSFRPDPTTREVIALVESRFAKHPGTLGAFDWPVTARQARQALDDFIAQRLANFGPYEDACPFTTLYWDFLARHQEFLRKNRRMSLQVKNIDRLDTSELRAVRKQADALRSRLAAGRGD